ncbi:MAG: integral rane protein [Nocardioides sp.]|nr:integral rane protein [Nocardioides sp.]
MSGQVHPTQDDPVVAGLSESVGGPAGDRIGRSRWWTPLRVVVLMAAVGFALGMVQKAPCVEGTWSEGDTRYSAMCYSDLPFLYTLRGFAEHTYPYTDDAETRERYESMEYPVGISYWAWATSRVTHWLSGAPDLDERYSRPVGELQADPEIKRETRLYVAVNALGLALLTILSAWLLAKVNPRRPWDAAIFALSPTLALTGLINWDLLAVATVAGALWAWARERPVLTGVLIGLGTAVKLFPLFLLGAILVLCLRRRRLDQLGAVVFAGLATWLLVNAPAYLASPTEWKVFWSFNSDRAADLGSMWLVIDQAGDLALSASTINAWSWAVFAIWCGGVFALGMLAPQTPRLTQLGFLIVAGFLLVNKVYSPQYVLWLLPLAVLARPRWRDQLVWQAGEVLYFATVWWYLGGYLEPAGGGDAGFYWVAILVRMLCELYLVAVVVRDVWWPGRDPVEREGQLTTTRSNAVAV